MLGKLLVIWGVLLPAIAFPWMRDFDPASGLLGSVRWMFTDVQGTRVVFHQVLSAGLVMVGLGLSLLVGRRGRMGAFSAGSGAGGPEGAGETPSPLRGEGVG